MPTKDNTPAVYQPKETLGFFELQNSRRSKQSKTYPLFSTINCGHCLEYYKNSHSQAVMHTARTCNIQGVLAKKSRIFSQTAWPLTSFLGCFLLQENGKEWRGQEWTEKQKKRSTGQHPPHCPLTIFTKYRETQPLKSQPFFSNH